MNEITMNEVLTFTYFCYILYISKRKGSAIMLRNDEVLKMFLANRIAKNRNLTSEGLSLVNYRTEIAYFKEGKLFISKSKYSQTTSKITNRLKTICLANSLVVNSYNPDKY